MTWCYWVDFFATYIAKKNVFFNEFSDYSSFDECWKSLELRYATQIWNEFRSKEKIPHDQSFYVNPIIKKHMKHSKSM